MKKFLTTVVLTFAVMAMNAATLDLSQFPSFDLNENNTSFRAPAAQKANPIELKEYKQATFECAFFDWWWFGNAEDESVYFGFVIFNEQGKEVAFTVMSPAETDMCAYYDNIQFKDDHEDRDVESHYYMSTYWILNCLNGVRLGGYEQDQTIIAQHIKEVNSNTSSMLALRSGTYYLRVYEMFISGGQASIGSGYDQVKFTLEGVELKDLKATVASDKKTAKISWTAPAAEDMPAGAYLYMNVSSGSETIFDNASSLKTALSNPLTIDVTEGRSYRVVAQYVTSRMSPLGSELACEFTVGTNQYVPTNLNATVTNDDQVDLTWSAAKTAGYYGVNVYANGFTYAQYTVTEQRLHKTLPEGTYTWEVAAFEKGDNGLVYQISDYVKGGSFTTKTAPLPEGTIEMNVWGMEAFYMPDEATGGKYPWLITLETGSTGGSGLPEVWIIVWSDREFGLSGNYSSAAGNIEISATAGNGSLINTNGTQAGLVTISSAEFKLEFDGFEQDYTEMGYYIPYYSGSFLIEAGGKTYHGTMNQLLCGTYDFKELTTSASSRTILYSMYDEGAQGIEDIDSSSKATKFIQDGVLVIEKNGVQYNVLGNRVK